MILSAHTRIAVNVIERNGFGLSTVRAAGDATHSEPARLVLLCRHADMADETPPAEARADVENGADVIATLLDGLDPLRTRFDLSSTLDDAQEMLKDGGTYYSVLVAIATPSRFVAASIGNVNVQLWRDGQREPLLKPTTVVVGKTEVLSNALGLGYERDEIQSADLSLANDDRILMGVNANLALLDPIHGRKSPSDILQLIEEQSTFAKSTIIGVIKAEA